MRRIVETIDGWSLQALVRVNCFIAAFVAIANGGFLMVSQTQEPSFPVTVRLEAGALFVGGLICLLVGLKRFPRLGKATPAHVQGALLLLFACVVLLDGIQVVLRGPPTDVRYTWNAPLVVAFIGYAVYFWRRSFLAPAQMQSPVFRFAHLWAAGAAAVLSALVLGRLS